MDKKLELFEKLRAREVSHRQSLQQDLIKVKILGSIQNGVVKEAKKWITRPLDIAEEVSKTLAKSALVCEVNGALWDLNRPLEADCELKILTFEDDKGRETFWHSSAHVLAQSLEMAYGCKLCIGPCTTTSNVDIEGFYYDAQCNTGLNEDHFLQILAGVEEAVKEKQPFERIQVSRSEALEMFSDNKFKVEIINDLPEEDKITVYRLGSLVDLCPGPHIPNTSFVKAFACLKASAAYWRGDNTRESLQRVHAISYPDQKQLKEYMQQLEEAKKYDHRVLGPEQELFFSHRLSPGSWFFQPRGTRIFNRLVEFIKAEYWSRGYQEVVTPNIYNMELWEKSGHAEKYRENMFVFEIENQKIGLKPMNCPGHCLIFQHRVRSYRELPLRLADFGVLHRNEASGALSGLTRVRRFQQDDAHIFCRESQVKEEVRRVLEFINYAYNIFGFTFELKLSTRPEKFLGDISAWDRAEAALTEALNEFGKPWKLNEGDGAFYGPKIDIIVSDALKRKFQCATLQLDFQLPSRFELYYSAEDEAKREKPVMIHRAVLGSVERMFAILLEHYKGKWPFWLSPRQAIVCSVAEKAHGYALKVQEQIHQAGYYVDVDISDKTIPNKVRIAQKAQYNYILVVGLEEAETGQVSVRLRDQKDMNIEDLLKHFKGLSIAQVKDKKDHAKMSVEDLLRHFKEEALAFH